MRALPPFANVPSSELVRLREHGSWLNIPPGTAVVEQGDVGDAFYAVGDGQFEVVVDGRRVGTCEPGGHFGELALLAEPRLGPRQFAALPRHASSGSTGPAFSSSSPALFGAASKGHRLALPSGANSVQA